MQLSYPFATLSLDVTYKLCLHFFFVTPISALAKGIKSKIPLVTSSSPTTVCFAKKKKKNKLQNWHAW